MRLTIPKWLQIEGNVKILHRLSSKFLFDPCHFFHSSLFLSMSFFCIKKVVIFFLISKWNIMKTKANKSELKVWHSGERTKPYGTHFAPNNKIVGCFFFIAANQIKVGCKWDPREWIKKEKKIASFILIQWFPLKWLFSLWYPFICILHGVLYGSVEFLLPCTRVLSVIQSFHLCAVEISVEHFYCSSTFYQFSCRINQIEMMPFHVILTRK